MASLLDQGFGRLAPGHPVARREAPPPRLPRPSQPGGAAAEQARPDEQGGGRLSRTSVAGRQGGGRPLARERARPAGEHWAIQLGAFKGEAAAEKAARAAAARLAEQGQAAPDRAAREADKDRLYRARLLNFTRRRGGTPRGVAQKEIACSVVPPGPAKVAAR